MKPCHGMERHYIGLNDLCFWKPRELLPITSSWQLCKFLPIDFYKGEKEKQEGSENKKGLISGVCVCVCLCVCIFFLTFVKLCKGFQRNLCPFHNRAEIKFSRRSVSGPWLFEGVSFLQCTSSKSLQSLLSILVVSQWTFKRNSSGDPPCLWG